MPLSAALSALFLAASMPRATFLPSVMAIARVRRFNALQEGATIFSAAHGATIGVLGNTRVPRGSFPRKTEFASNTVIFSSVRNVSISLQLAELHGHKFSPGTVFLFRQRAGFSQSPLGAKLLEAVRVSRSWDTFLLVALFTLPTYVFKHSIGL